MAEPNTASVTEGYRAICAELGPYLSDQRKQTIQRVLENRTRSTRIILDSIGNEHNAGAVLRTAEAFGIQDLHVLEKKSAFRASRGITQGCQKWLALHHHQDHRQLFSSLRAEGFKIWAAAVHGHTLDVKDIPTDSPVAMVFGNEAEGIHPEVIADADGCFKVPMVGFVESLNISVAAAVSLRVHLDERRIHETLWPLEPARQLKLRAEWYARSVRASRQILERKDLAWPSLVTDNENILKD